MTRSPSGKTERAWAAGFFDGEGHVSFRRASSSFGISIGQKDRRPLERFHAVVGCHRGRLYFAPKQSVDPVYWRLDIEAAADVLAVYAILKTYLSDPKREQFEHAITAYESRVDMRKQFGNKESTWYKARWAGRTKAELA